MLYTQSQGMSALVRWGLPKPHCIYRNPLKNTLAGEVVSVLSQDHRLQAFWWRHMIWPTKTVSRGWRAWVLRWFAQDIDPRSPNPSQCLQPRPLYLYGGDTSQGCKHTDLLLPRGSWSPWLIPSRCALIWNKYHSWDPCCFPRNNPLEHPGLSLHPSWCQWVMSGSDL